MQRNVPVKIHRKNIKKHKEEFQFLKGKARGTDVTKEAEADEFK